MKIYTNTKRVRQKQRLGTTFSLTGALVMALGLVVTLRPGWELLAWAIALTGLAIASVGTYHVNRWVRPPLPEPLLADTLRRLDARHLLFNHIGPVPHLLLTPQGLVAIHAKRYDGPATFDARTGRWRGRFSLRRFYGQGLTAETLGNPTAEVAQAKERVRGWLRARLPDVADAVPVEGLALFVSPKVQLSAEGAPVPIAQPATLKRVVQGLVAGWKAQPMTKNLYDRVRAALEAEGPRDAAQAAE